jgi:aminoglycoside 6'-N-acetyltransferase
VAADSEPGAAGRPVLAGRVVTIRPGGAGDAARLHAILAEPSVARWWGEPDPVPAIEDDLRGDGSSVLLVVEVGGQVAGGIQYHEENEPMYRHAGIDIYLGTGFQGRGAGTEAVGLLARYLFEQRGHHRLTIDPGRGQRAGHPQLRQGRVPPGGRDAAVRARPRRPLPRRPADGPAPPRTHRRVRCRSGHGAPGSGPAPR